jgi:MFS family permease
VRSPRATVWSLFATAAVLSQGYGVMFTLIGRFRDDYGISESHLGVVVGAGFFTSFLGQLLIAPLADRGWAKALLLGGIATNALGLLVMATSTSFAGLFTGRFVMGLGIGSAYPAIRRAIAVAEPDRVGENSGRLLSADVLGFLMGPLIAFLTVDRWGLNAPFYIGIALGLVALLLCWGVPMGAVVDEAMPTQRLAVDLLRERWMQACVLFGIAFFAMIGTFDALWALRITDIVGDEDRAGPYVQLGIVIFALPLVLLGNYGGKVAERRGPLTVAAIGLSFGVCFVSLYGLIAVPAILVLVGVTQATVDSFGAPGIPIAVTKLAPPQRIAGAQGLVGATQTLTGGVMSVIAGVLYDRFGPVPTYLSTSAFMALCVIGGVVLSAPYRRNERVGAPSGPAMLDGAPELGEAERSTRSV